MNTIEDRIKALGQEKKFTKWEMLFYAQDKADGLYLVLSGEIRVYKMDDQGKEVEVVRLGPGDFFGEAILFVAEVFPVYAQAVRDAKVVFLEKNELFLHLERDPSLAKFFLTLLAKKCVTLNQRIEILGLHTVRQRLIRYLMSFCQGQESCVVNLSVKKSELAKILGTISETLSRNLKQLQDEGLIDVQANSIHIKDCKRLRSEITN